MQARFFGLCDGWIAIIPNSRYLGPFDELRSAALEALAYIDRTEGVASRVGSILYTRPGDLVFEPYDAGPDRRRSR